MEEQISNNQNRDNQNSQIIDFPSLVVKMSKDMKFLSICTIIYGAISCLTIIGAAFGVPYIIAGIRLRESAEQFNNYIFNNNMASLEIALERQQRFFFIFKVLTIIGIIFTVLVIIFYIVLISYLMSNGYNLFREFNDMAFLN